MKLEGKTAAIIGGGGGIGRAIAFALAARGVTVFIGDISTDAARETSEHVLGMQVAAGHARCDIGDDASVAAFADRAFAELRRVDLLFNHAGVSVGGLLEEVTADDWNWLLNINVTGLGRSVAAFLPRMTAQGGGWIVNTSSGLGLFHDVPFAAPYAASKAAIIGYSRALATYTLNRGIGVSVLCPDITMTGFVTSGRLKGIPPDLAAAALPLDRIQTPEQVAELAIKGIEGEQFLISAVPNTRELLLAMAKAELLPPGVAPDRDVATSVKLTGSVRLPVAAIPDGLARFTDFAKRSKRHHGCIAYDVSVDPDDLQRIRIGEEWRDQGCVDAHAAAPDTVEFVHALIDIGASDFALRRI